MKKYTFSTMLEDENPSQFLERPPFQEEEVLAQARKVLGHIPEWYLENKERLSLERQMRDHVLQKLRDELVKLKKIKNSL